MSGLEILRLTLIVVHLLGLAAIIGPFLLQLRDRSGYRFGWMLTGSIIGPKIGVKLALALIVATAIAVAVAVRRPRAARGARDAGLRPLLYTAGSSRARQDLPSPW